MAIFGIYVKFLGGKTVLFDMRFLKGRVVQDFLRFAVLGVSKQLPQLPSQLEHGES